MHRHRSAPLLVSAALLQLGCTYGIRPSGFTTPRTTQPITRVELQASGVRDPYDAVSLLRPGWLRPRVRTGRAEDRDGLPVVYAQNVRLGALHELADLCIDQIEEIRYVHPLDATTRWGMGHTDGVIEVIWVNQPYR